MNEERGADEGEMGRLRRLEEWGNGEFGVGGMGDWRNGGKVVDVQERR